MSRYAYTLFHVNYRIKFPLDQWSLKFAKISISVLASHNEIISTSFSAPVSDNMYNANFRVPPIPTRL